MKKSDYHPLTIDKEVLRIVKEWAESERDGDLKAREKASSILERFLVETADGTFTLQSEPVNKVRETMHTHHGALQEARKKFSEPADLQGKEEVAILDICSGLGYNAAAALENCTGDGKKDLKVVMDLVEVSWETLALALLLPVPVESHSIVKRAMEDQLIKAGFLSFHMEKTEIPSYMDITVHLGDARELIKGIEKDFYDAVFLDPFSPAKSPELYSLEFCQGLRRVVKNDGLILTYTSAAPVRSALLEAGLEVGEGPAMGRRGGTVASPSLNRISRNLSRDDERMIALSDAGIPFRDPERDSSAGEIAQRRDRERKEARNNYKLASTVKTPVYLAEDIEDKRIKRKVVSHLQKLGLTDLKSQKSLYLVCPQYPVCICHCGQERPLSSRERIREMTRRLNITIMDNKG
jgi:tRNA U34 5-methylaminomethyl-2-thiouridine-forming methyltransferase MnmC